MSEYTTSAQVNANPPQPASFPSGGSYVVAVLFPVLGVIFGIVALAKNRVGPGLAVIATSALAAVAWLYVFALTAS